MAILLQEADADQFARAMTTTQPLAMSAANLVELGIVCLRRGGAPLFDKMKILLREASVEVVAVMPELAWSALDAYRRFGLGIGKPACLNLGDCFAYALAKELNEPLLYKGDDFSKTDIRSAL